VTRILEALPRFNGGDFIFSTTFGRVPVSGFSKAKARLDALVAEELGRPIEPFTIHDLRRTMRTGLSSLPIPDLVRELVIAHTKPGLHKVYDQFAYVEEKRRALELWEARVREILLESVR
jgi:integrase